MARDLWKELGPFLERLRAAVATESPSRRECEELFEDYLGATRAAAPNPAVERFFHHVDILRDLAWDLPQAGDLPEALPYEPPDHRRSFFRVRQLGLLGTYPNFEVASGRAAYVIRNGLPYLVTLNSAREDAKWHTFSELSDWTRQETRIATAISCTEYGGFTAYLSHYGHDFPVTLLSHVEEHHRATFMIEYVALAERARLRPFERRTPATPTPEFWDFSPYRQTARAFARKFLVSHQVLLRTGRQYVKASMMWQTDAFREDAMVTLMFALEGCILLLQEEHGGRTDRIDRRHLRQILMATYRHGEVLYDTIEEAMGWGGTRAQLIHPQLATVEGWTTQVMADDYYELHEIVRALLTYIVTGGAFEEYELAV